MLKAEGCLEMSVSLKYILQKSHVRLGFSGSLDYVPFLAIIFMASQLWGNLI